MYQTLLFKESPIITGSLLISLGVSVKYKYRIGIILSIILIVVLMLFYRYKPHKLRYADNIIISPAQGLITDIEQRGRYVYISIYLDAFDNHTQIYPVNGVVIERVYDNIGKYYLANTHKGRGSEKKMCIIKMGNGGTLYLTQIAGFFPRRIVSSDKAPERVMAGEYLGMIKFGSRVDIMFNGDSNNLRVKPNQRINIGDLLYVYI